MTSSWRLDETSCGYVCCQHPSCWASQRRQEKGIPNVLPPIELDSDSSSDELDLPTQSIVNLLGDYGDSTVDRYPLSAGGRPSYQWDSSTIPRDSTVGDESFVSRLNLSAPPNTKASFQSKRTQLSVRKPKLKLVEMQEVFDRDDLNSQWDETFMTKQYYVWMPNPNRKRKGARHLEKKPHQPVLMKDLTECMVPSEIEHKRDETILYDEFPVLKKRQSRTRSPQRSFVPGHAVAPFSNDVDRDGINEILSLPKETLMKVLEYTKKSDFTSKGKLHSIIQACINEDEQVQMALTARELFTHKPMEILDVDPAKKTPHPRSSPTKPVFQLDDDGVIDRMSYVNTPVKDKDLCSEADSVDTFPRYKQPLPNITGKRRVNNAKNLSQSVQLHRPKIASISLGLPELPSGIKTTRPFTYRKQDIDFSLGPIITPPSSYRSSLSGTYSDHGTTVKVNASSTLVGMMDSYGQESKEMGFHSVSPAFSTNVPMPPAGTPATFQSPTKSAPNLREITRDTTQITVNWSLHAQPPSREVKDEILIPSPGLMDQSASPNTTHAPGVEAGDEQGLDTINETAHENQEGSVSSPQVAGADKTSNAVADSEVNVPPIMQLEASALSNIHTAVTPMPKSARSVESCPSPEQWPLVSESSFEQMPRLSISEPALSARSDRRRPISRGKDDQKKGVNKDFARKVLNEKIEAESPAPPPPSPEPKEPGEYRARKDIKSRESLSMAPLFEVTEMEEGSPTPQTNKKDVQQRQGKTRHIEVTVPVGKEPADDKKKEKEEEFEIVSQITVTHIPPKGRDPNAKKGEKVQEMFLNVDIPAEDISSVKAENGSSIHHEDISSNDTVIQSQHAATGSESSPTPGDNLDVKMGDVTPEPEDTALVLDGIQDNEDDQAIQDDEQNAQKQDGDSQKDESNLSTESPELECESARFFSHDLVSPIKDSDTLTSARQENTEMLPVGLEESDMSEMKGEPLINSERNEIARADSPEDKSLSILDGNNESQIATNEEQESFDGEPPGSFFFSQSPPDDTKQFSNEAEKELEKQEEHAKEQLQETDKEDDGIEAKGWMERAVASVEPVREEQPIEATNHQNLNQNQDSTMDNDEIQGAEKLENKEQSKETKKVELNKVERETEQKEDESKECANEEDIEETKQEDLIQTEGPDIKIETESGENENSKNNTITPEAQTSQSSPAIVSESADAFVTAEEETGEDKEVETVQHSEDTDNSQK